MAIDGEQLSALAAVVELGSFDAAAQRLHVTPSAVSQRIKALEQRVGQVLVVRAKPCAATPAGLPLVKLAAQWALLESEALAEFDGPGTGRIRAAVAVNADSMSTWFPTVFEHVDGALFDIRIADQDHSAQLLRDGLVMGAVTTERAPVPGCRVQPLGVMRYVPVASTDYVRRLLPQGFTAEAAANAPCVAWSRDDALQDMLVRKVFRRHIAMPVHYVPTAEGFGAALRAGLGWGMFPQGSTSEPEGALVRISDAHLDVPLFWQSWKMDSPMITTITAAVRAAAAKLSR